MGLDRGKLANIDQRVFAELNHAIVGESWVYPIPIDHQFPLPSPLRGFGH